MMTEKKDKNKIMLESMSIQRDVACREKEAQLKKLKRARNDEVKAELKLAAEKWARREAMWADEIKFRKSMGFGS